MTSAVNNTQQCITTRQAPVAVTAQTADVYICNILFRIATVGSMADAAILGTGVAVRAVAVVPGVDVVLVAQAAIIGFDLPNQAGDVVAGAGPVVGAAAQLGAGWKLIAAVGYFAVVKTIFHAIIRRAGADFGQFAVAGRLVTAVLAVLPFGVIRVGACFAGGGIAIQSVTAPGDTGVIQGLCLGV